MVVFMVVLICGKEIQQLCLQQLSQFLGSQKPKRMVLLTVYEIHNTNLRNLQIFHPTEKQKRGKHFSFLANQRPIHVMVKMQVDFKVFQKELFAVEMANEAIESPSCELHKLVMH